MLNNPIISKWTEFKYISESVYTYQSSLTILVGVWGFFDKIVVPVYFLSCISLTNTHATHYRLFHYYIRLNYGNTAFSTLDGYFPTYCILAFKRVSLCLAIMPFLIDVATSHNAKSESKGKLFSFFFRNDKKGQKLKARPQSSSSFKSYLFTA